MSKWQVLRRIWAAGAMITLIMIMLGKGCSGTDEAEPTNGAAHETKAAEESVPAPPTPTGNTAAMVVQPEKCRAADDPTNRDVRIKSDASLKIAPAESAADVGYKLSGNEIIPGIIDRNVPLREMCRRGQWSRVRLLGPSELRRVEGWAPTSSFGWVPTHPDGRRRYLPSDFEFPASARRYADVVVATINRSIANHKSCDAIDQSSLLVEEGPTFTALCTGDGGNQVISFSLAEARAGKVVTPVPDGGTEAPGEPPLSAVTASEAWAMCEQPLRSQLAHPSTADFNMWDTHVQAKPTSDMFTVGLTAKNGMGLELRFMGYCEIQGGRVTAAHVVERTD